MIDRRKVAMVLLLVGAGLAAVASFQDTYKTVYRDRDFGQEQTISTTLWIITSDMPANNDRTAYFAAGWPVMIAVIVMVLSVVLIARDRTAHVGRPLAVGAAGALAGSVLFYVLQLERVKAILAEWGSVGSQSQELNYLTGSYLLVGAAIIGLVGAALAQQRQQVQPEVDDDEEEEVVVHQLGNDDDTPPFGIAMPPQDEYTPPQDELISPHDEPIPLHDELIPLHDEQPPLDIDQPLLPTDQPPHPEQEKR
ncbi:hypothetical protein ACIA8G_28630 [Lentzea sp. NPDC051213]|uniref:hypothetical protein n=1 Tax=Lentzea sp. NPDC051213 TaxID=3364126 RepID=UPI003796BBF5